MDELKTPWPDDYIRFTPGEWEIVRAENYGLYRIFSGGRPSGGTVDAVQLIEWGMAELVVPMSEEDPSETVPQTQAPVADVMTFSSSKKAPEKPAEPEKPAADLSEITKRLSKAGEGDLSAPWPEDDILFLKGDWQIVRAETEGEYCYSFSGVPAPRTATATQLIEWKMAEKIRYDALFPWEGSDIRYTTDTVVLRDLSDVGTAEGDRGYFLKSGRLFYYVNRYYLVKNKLAEGGEEFKRAVLSARVALPPSDGVEPWPEDGIVLCPQEDVTVKRGLRPGMYRVVKHGINANWPAFRLIEEGLAVSLFEKKLDLLCTQTKVTMSKIGKALEGFWMSETPCKTLYEIAVLWRTLSTDPGCPQLLRIHEYNQALIDAYRAVTENRPDPEELRRACAEAVGEAEREYEAAKEFSVLCKNFWTISVNESEADTVRCIAGFAESEQAFISAMARFDEAAARAAEGGAPVELPKGEPFPQKLLPQAARQWLAADYAAIEAARASVPGRKRVDVSRELRKASDLRARFPSLKHDVTLAQNAVDAVRARRSELGRVCQELDPKRLSKKPSAFRHPWKYDGIRFTTGIRVTHLGAGKYEVPYGSSTVTVTAEELVFMGLAEKIR